MLFFNLCGSVAAAGQESSVVQMIPATVDMTSTEDGKSVCPFSGSYGWGFWKSVV